LVVDRLPDLVRRSLRGADDGSNVLGDGVVHLAQDALIHHDPI
jgi:hypothetical protein